MKSKMKPNSFIINVSSMESSFVRRKTPDHPHTNGAKAFLDMITRTSSSEYAKSGIYMNSVDTGWITNENPKSHLSEFSCPIDEIDGAARVLDPIVISKRDGDHYFGQFYKDYKPIEIGLPNVHF